MSDLQTPLLTPAEYLAFERASELKHEYVAGEVVAMARKNLRHNFLQVAVGSSLNNTMRDRFCDVYLSDMRVKVVSLGVYTYPDISVVCGDVELEDDEQDTLLNPTVIIEILSPSTASYDRGRKFHRYQLIPSLRDYLLIAQDRPLVEHYARDLEGHWALAHRATTGEQVQLSSIGGALDLAAIYRKVSFDAASE